MGRVWWVFGCASGLLGVLLGAFGAHALKTRLSAELLATFEVGVRYQLYHGLALLLIGLRAEALLRAGVQGRALTLVQVAGGALSAGIVLFSGSLYALALSGIRVLGAITPLGGLAFLVGWAALAASVLVAQ